jgi:hypothetical protein
VVSDELRAAAKAVSGAVKKAKRPPQWQIPWLEADPAFDEGISLWHLAPNRIRGYNPDGTKYELGTTTLGSSTGSSLPADPEPADYTTTYSAQWGQTFCDLHGVETGGGIWFGDSPGGDHAGRKIMIGLPDSTIRTDLTGADIDLVELKMIVLDAYQKPVTVHLGLHAQTSAPSTYSAVQKDAQLLDYPNAEWQKIHPAFGRWLRDDYGRGLTIDQPSGFINAGQLDWASVQIRFTYSK